jgi:hypothetical protein
LELLRLLFQAILDYQLIILLSLAVALVVVMAYQITDLMAVAVLVDCAQLLLQLVAVVH